MDGTALVTLWRSCRRAVTAPRDDRDAAARLEKDDEPDAFPSGAAADVLMGGTIIAGPLLATDLEFAAGWERFVASAPRGEEIFKSPLGLADFASDELAKVAD